MVLTDGSIGSKYCVMDISLNRETEYRLEALGLTFGSNIEIINKKKNGSLMVRIRGTRFAMGKDIANGISVESLSKSGEYL